jgi:hypothetical protein
MYIYILNPNQRVACERVTVGWVVRERGHPVRSSCGELLELPTSYLLAQSAGREDRYTISVYMEASGEKPLSTRRMRACDCGVGGARTRPPDTFQLWRAVGYIYTNLLARRERAGREDRYILCPHSTHRM